MTDVSANVCVRTPGMLGCRNHCSQDELEAVLGISVELLGREKDITTSRRWWLPDMSGDRRFAVANCLGGHSRFTDVYNGQHRGPVGNSLSRAKKRLSSGRHPVPPINPFIFGIILGDGD